MQETRYYKVGGHVFSLSAEPEIFQLTANYEPFACHEEETTFRLSVENGETPAYTEELRQDDYGQEIICGHTAEGLTVFEFCWQKQSAGCLVCTSDYACGRLVTTGRHTKLAVDNALMVFYALATADKSTVLFHAAIVSHHNKGYMFLGPSGTGKSTHARLWLKYIGDTALVNDDNPVVRIGDDGQAVVYGSPWSGKTPCYRNVNCPLGGIVLLRQAPYNKIRRMNGIEAYVALMTSISGKRWDESVADGLHQTENRLAMQVPVWHLECLPDDEAARLCESTIGKG